MIVIPLKDMDLVPMPTAGHAGDRLRQGRNDIKNAKAYTEALPRTRVLGSAYRAVKDSLLEQLYADHGEQLPDIVLGALAKIPEDIERLEPQHAKIMHNLVGWRGQDLADACGEIAELHHAANWQLCTHGVHWFGWQRDGRKIGLLVYGTHAELEKAADAVASYWRVCGKGVKVPRPGANNEPPPDAIVYRRHSEMGRYPDTETAMYAAQDLAKARKAMDTGHMHIEILTAAHVAKEYAV